MPTPSAFYRSLRIATATAAIAGVSIIALAPAAGATMGCGQHSYGFDGTRLLNNGISNTAGPFTIETLPAGTYDIIVQSYDAHDEHPGQTDQTAEQWYFTLDSGYTSPLSTDIPDASNHTIDVWDAQVIDTAATTVTLHHRGEGNVNSVDPICVGFTPTPAEPAQEGPTTTVAEPVIDEPTAPAAEPLIAGPTLPIADAEHTSIGAVTDAATTPVVVEVKPAVETTQVEEVLALTGPSHAQILSGIGLGALALGMGLVTAERRTRTS